MRLNFPNFDSDFFRTNSSPSLALHERAHHFTTGPILVSSCCIPSLSFSPRR